MLTEKEPMSSRQLASTTGTSEQYVREWASAQAASGFIEYDTEGENFSMTPEQIMASGDRTSLVFMTGAFYANTSLYLDEPKMIGALKTGGGDGPGCSGW